MNRTISRLLVGLLATSLAVPALAAPKPAAAASAPASNKSGVLATVNGKTIPQSVADMFAAEQVARGQKDTKELREQIRTGLIRNEVLAQEAKKAGVDKKPGFQTRLELVQQNVLISAYVENYMKSIQISEADLKKEYKDLVAKNARKEYKAHHILVEKEDEAKAIIAKMKGGAKITDLAKDSKDPGSKDKGGDLPWNSAENFDPAFGNALKALDKGKFTTEPVKSNFGYHVIQLDDVRDVAAPPFEQVKGQIQQRLQQQRVEKHVADLVKQAKVQ